jgi:hypothetical protein
MPAVGCRAFMVFITDPCYQMDEESTRVLASNQASAEERKVWALNQWAESNSIFFVSFHF